MGTAVLSVPQVVPLTTYPGVETEPSFSPDGTRLAFVWGGNEDDNRDIYVLRLGEDAPLRLTSDPDRDRGPVWSPDGRSIAFNAPGEGGAPDLFVVYAAGGNPHQLTRHPAHDEQPNWSRDGRWIYFQSDSSGRWEVMRIPSDGGEAEEVTENGGYRPAQSPDGSKLYYLRPGPTEVVPLYARPAAGGPERQVLESVRWCFWVVEGGIYYFAAGGEDGSLPLRYYDFAGGKSRLLTNVKGRDIWDLTSSPDGKIVLFPAESPWRIDLMLAEDFR